MKQNPFLSPTPSSPSPQITLPEGVIAVSKDQTVSLPTSQVTLRLTSASIPKENCRDCITKVSLEVQNDTKKQIIEFKSGGIMGSIPKSQLAFGYVFDLYDVTSDQILIQYKKQ